MKKSQMIKFRCSELHFLLTDPRGKSEVLSKTTLTYLKEVFIRENFNRSKKIKSKYLDKGSEGEDDSMNLLSSVTGCFLFKNSERKENDFISGEWDTTRGEIVIDTKTSWDIFTFGSSKPDKNYVAQLNGYMWLLGFEKAELSYCLIDTPEHLILDMFRRDSWDKNIIDLPDQQKYEIAKNHIYTSDYLEVMWSAHFPKADVSDFIPIPKKDRVKTFYIDWDQELIDKIKTRIELSRDILKDMSL